MLQIYLKTRGQPSTWRPREQLTEEERAVVSAERSDVVPGKMGFICGSDNKVIFRLGYVGRKDGKHVWKRS